MKLAHLILAHSKVSQLERLIMRLEHDSADIFIQLDKKANMADFEYLKKLKNVYFIKRRVKVFWGTYSMVKATLNGMKEILLTGNNYSHINLLSGQDYLLKSNDEIVEFLLNNAGKNFMSHLPIETDFAGALPRVVKYQLGDYRIKGIFTIESMVNSIARKRTPPAGLELYGLSQWLTITSKSAAYVLEYLRTNPRVKRYFRMTGGPDEFMFQTILQSSPYKNDIVNDNLRHIRFLPGHVNPITLTMENLEELTGSGKLFARKFDAEASPEILNHLDKVAGLVPEL